MRRDNRLIFILLTAVLLRLATLETQAVVFTDSADYLRLAENIFSGKGYKNIWGAFSERPPLYSILTGLLRFIIPDTENCGKIISMVFGVLIVYLIYKIGVIVFGKSVALLAAGIASIHPFLIEISTFVLRDSLHLSLLLAAVLFTVLAVMNGRKIYPFLIGFFLGLGYLTRIETVLYLGSILLFLGFFKPSKKVSTLTAIIAIFFITIVPYLVMIKASTGNVSIGGEMYLLKGIINTTIQSGDNNFLQGKALFFKYINNINKAYLVALPMIFPPLLLFFFAIGMAVDNHSSDKIKFIILTLFLFLPLLFHPFHYINPRYFLIFIAMGLIFASNGIIYFSDRWERIFPVLKGKLIFILFFVMLISFIPKMTQPFREDKYYRHWIEHKDMGLWMRDNIGGEPRIISRKPFVALYAGGLAIFLPDLEPESLYVFAIENKAAYLVADERSRRRYKYEKMWPLLSGEIPKGFKLIKEIEERPGYKIRLFEIVEKL